MQLDKMEGYIERNSKARIEAKDRIIDHLRAKLKIAESLIDFELTTELEARYDELGVTVSIDEESYNYVKAENERLREKLDDAIEYLKETHRDPAKYDLCFDKRDIEELESK